MYPIIRQKLYSRKTSIPFVLDALGAVSSAAYSIRSLKSSYSGSSIRVRRSSDNAESNIGFASNGGLDESALLAFTGAGDGFITTWYDQSGNGVNATQATAAGQPKIVASGAIITSAGKPTLKTTKGVTSLTTGNMVAGANASMSMVFQRDSAAGFDILVGTGNYYGWVSGDQITLTYGGQVFSVLGAEATTNPTQSTFTVDGATGTIYQNGIQKATGNTMTSASLSTIAAFGGFSLGGAISEVIGFNSTLSTTDRQTLERDQGSYYGITVA